MRITLNMKCENAAFGDDGEQQAAEVARILRELADTIEQCGDALPFAGSFALMDANGNRCGTFTLEA